MKAHKRFTILLWLFPWACLFWEPLASVLLVLMLVNNYTIPGAFKSLRLLKHWPLSIALFALYAYTLLSGFWSDDLGEFAIKSQIKASFLLLPLVFFPVIKVWKVKITHRFMANLHSSVVAAALYCYLDAAYRIITTGQWVRLWEDGSVHDYHLLYTGLSEPLGHPAYLSMYAGLAVFIAFTFALKEPTRRNYWSFWVAFDLIFLGMLQGKMNLLAFGLVAGFALVSLAIRFKAYRKLALLVAVPVVIALGLVVFKPAAFSERFREPFKVDYDITSNSFADFTSLTIRLAEWQCATDVVEEYPMFGVGLGDARGELLQTYENNDFTLGIENKFNCHNQYLENTLAGGIVGLSLLIAVFLVGFTTGWRRKNGVLILSVAYFALAILTESMFERFQGVVLFTLVLTIYSIPMYHRSRFIKKQKNLRFLRIKD